MSTTDYIVESFLSLVRGLPPDEQRKVFASVLDSLDKIRMEMAIPVSIFSRKLGSLESIVKYLVENVGLSTKEIAKILDRSHSSIITTYSKSKKKAGKIIAKDSIYKIPARVIADKRFGVLENIVGFLKSEYGLHFSDIAGMLERNYQTVRTAYVKYNEKRNGTD